MAGAAHVAAAVIAADARPSRIAATIGPVANPASPAAAPVRSVSSAAERDLIVAPPTTFTTAQPRVTRAATGATRRAVQRRSRPATAFTRAQTLGRGTAGTAGGDAGGVGTGTDGWAASAEATASR